MTDYRKLAEKTARLAEKKLGKGYHVSINNPEDRKHYIVTVCWLGGRAGINIDIAYFAELGSSAEEITAMIAGLAYTRMPGSFPIPVTGGEIPGISREDVLKHAAVCLYPHGKAGNLPHIVYLGMDAVFAVTGTADRPGITSLVTDAVMEHYGLTKNDLLAAAKENMVFGAERVRVVAPGMHKNPFRRIIPGLLIMSMDDLFGASALLNTSILCDAASKIGDNIFILTINIHAILAIPMSPYLCLPDPGRFLKYMASDIIRDTPEDIRLDPIVYSFMPDRGNVEIAY